MKKLLLLPLFFLLSSPCFAQAIGGGINNPGASSGGGGTPGGTSGQIQYNNAGAFGGVTSVPIANGGTNATTAAGALTNLGAQQAITLTTTGTSGAATLNAGTGTLNIPQYTGGGVSSFTGDGTIISNSASTGAVTATLANQTANTVLGALTATTPSDLPLPSCNGATKALGYTSGTGFTCNSSITGANGINTFTTTGTSGAATFSGGTLNIPQYSSSTFQAAMAAETQLSIGGL